MEYAASTGRLEIVKWLQEQRDTGDKETLQDDTRVQKITEVEVYIVQPMEILETSLQVVNWVAVFPKRKVFREVFASRAGLLADVYDQRDPLLPWDEAHALRTLLERRRYRALDTAAAQGDLVMVKRLHEDGRWPCSSVAMDTAAGNGHLEVVKFLHDNRREGGTAIAMCSAAGNGHLEVVEWLHKNRGSDGYRSLVLDLAATNGHVDVLRWLVPRFPRLSCSPAFLPSVAAHGHIETLRYLHEEMHMALDLRVLESAIGSGHLPLVNYVADRLPAEVKNTLSPSVAEKAAASGNLELLAFVVERLGLWSPNMLGSAATTGNVELAEWIVIRSDSPLTELLNNVNGSTLYRCASMGHFNMIEWLLKRELASPSFVLSMKERELVLRSVVGRGVFDSDSLEAVFLFGDNCGDKSGAASTSAEPSTGVATGVATTTAAMVIATVTGSETGSGTVSGGRVSTTQKKPGFDAYAWGLPGKTSPKWQRRFVRLVVQYEPKSTLSLEWIPLWAAQRGELSVMQQLYSVKHPQLFTQQTFMGIMRYTKAGDVLQWFQTHSPTNIGNSAVVAWGVKYRQFAYLSYIFLEFQPIRTEERFRLHGVEYALHVACAMGHLDVVTWICGNCEIFLNVPAAELHAKLGRLSIWKDALVAAARNGQVKILAWLHEKFTFFQKVPDSPRKMTLVGAMADAAAGHGQCCVLRWLQATVGPQMECPTDEHTKSAKAEDQPPMAQTSFVSTPGLLEAMVNRHIDVVQWICAADIDLVGRQTPERRGELATFLREEADGFVPSKLGFVFPPL
ncbi:hypothetical protein BBO99_00006649 [Phytophthora kernoviae]|uniref:Uncharacterized protein n=2 Tax=Phytophthora kernoviae TaxID=325452 RepID=A0A3R7GWN1_9STRA|nr:hypothetical protein G195_011549 [Phytophthora kernoviae 00238/432]KAG2520946.1 hypothetical protein JM18_006106 [Phytophthora kernoviae]RLN20122.1 hypothetical protein BBI17_006662 [Phytophthora kernoviae]RLN77552.1 hypothetical protein BBO99_00006649 [Phytophthora kernoviae]